MISTISRRIAASRGNAQKFIASSAVAPSHHIRVGCHMMRLHATSAVVNTHHRFYSTQSAAQDTSSTPPKILDFDNTYSVRSTCDLLTSYAVLKSCSNPLILKHGPTLMEKAGMLAVLPTKHTYYKYFVGGETVETCKSAIDSLQAEGIDVVLDYSVEGLASESQADLLAKELVHSINFSGQINRENKKRICRFGCAKLTGIANTSLLLKLSQVIEYVSCTEYHKQVNGSVMSKEDRNALAKEIIPEALYIPNYFLAPSKTPSFQLKGVAPDQVPRLTPEEHAEVDRLVARFRLVCEACVRNDVPLLVDAEHSYYQGAIDYLAMKMNLEYSGPVSDPQAFSVIYNTYQNYLRDAQARMMHDHDFVTKEHGLKFAAKCVRGAYMRHERERAKSLGLPDPIHENIQGTHDSYNSMVEYGLENLSNMGVFIATHNQETLQRVTDLIVNKYQLKRNQDGIVFAQLYGMGDSLSLALAQAGFNVAKYVPYGPVQEVMPYLSRRVSENGDIFSGTVVETRRIAQELKKKLPFFRG